jgi:hypothetical protein
MILTATSTPSWMRVARLTDPYDPLPILSAISWVNHVGRSQGKSQKYCISYQGLLLVHSSSSVREKLVVEHHRARVYRVYLSDPSEVTE